MKKQVLTGLFLGMALQAAYSQKVEWNTPGAGNPFIPGYFADPTVKKFGDTYYVYATTDGSGAGFGPSQVWCSKDFENWTIMPMNWPDSHWIWAPDVMKHTDGTIGCSIVSRVMCMKEWPKRHVARGRMCSARVRRSWYPTDL